MIFSILSMAWVIIPLALVLVFLWVLWMEIRCLVKRIFRYGQDKKTEKQDNKHKEIEK